MAHAPALGPAPFTLTLHDVLTEIRKTTRYDTANFIMTIISFVIVVGGLAYNSWHLTKLRGELSA